MANSPIDLSTFEIKMFDRSESDERRSRRTFKPETGVEDLEWARQVANKEELRIQLTSLESLALPDATSKASLKVRDSVDKALHVLMHILGIKAFTKVTFSKDNRWFASTVSNVATASDVIGHLGLADQFAEVFSELYGSAS